MKIDSLKKRNTHPLELFHLAKVLFSLQGSYFSLQFLSKYSLAHHLLLLLFCWHPSVVFSGMASRILMLLASHIKTIAIFTHAWLLPQASSTQLCVPLITLIYTFSPLYCTHALLCLLYILHISSYLAMEFLLWESDFPEKKPDPLEASMDYPFLSHTNCRFLAYYSNKLWWGQETYSVLYVNWLAEWNNEQ